MELREEWIADAVREALREDLGSAGDITSRHLLPADRDASARIVARQELVLAGLPLARKVFETLDADCRFSADHRDGERLAPLTVVARLKGNAIALLEGERTALNFVMRMSGVATATAAAVNEVAGTGVAVLDTRKTIPGWRRLDKYAVATGGGTNHRMGLFDAAMIKDTHLALSGGIGPSVARLRSAGIPADRITAEVRSEAELAEAIRAGAGRALLDNMSPAGLRACVARGKGKIVLEASGGLRPGRLREVAETGVDCLSLGWLTHSAPAADLAMEMDTAPASP